jgi:dTDP-4-dehydrorhamnose reductase
MKVLVFGSTGQLGQSLLRFKPEDCEILSPNKHELDFYNGTSLCNYVIKHAPDWIINAAAYTDVNKAEKERSVASDVNHGGPASLAWGCNISGSKLLQISTDYVFDGLSTRPYTTADLPNPLNYYGHTKLKGEQAITDIMRTGSYCILRSSWLYSAVRRNFFKTILDSLIRKKFLSVVNDQIGCPTSVDALSAVCWQIIKTQTMGLYHYSEAPAMSWFDFALKIRALAANSKLFDELGSVDPVSTADYDSMVFRPAYSALDNTELAEAMKLPEQDWEKSLKTVFYDFVLPVN